MPTLDERRAARPYPCCREAANLVPVAVDGTPGPGVLARECEQCQVCGRRHRHATLAAGAYGVVPQPIGG